MTKRGFELQNFDETTMYEEPAVWATILLDNKQFIAIEYLDNGEVVRGENSYYNTQESRLKRYLKNRTDIEISQIYDVIDNSLCDMRGSKGKTMRLTDAQFDFLADKTRLKDTARSAARASLVEGKGPSKIKEEWGIAPQGLHVAVTRIKKEAAKFGWISIEGMIHKDQLIEFKAFMDALEKDMIE